MGKALEIFAARIKELRDEQGLGLREAAAKMGISHSAILKKTIDTIKKSPRR
jgi:transcriptional regulator with XRE-family HTH domain